MRRASRWAVALTAVAASVALAAGCGASDGNVASVPAAPGAQLADRLLSAEELGIPGFTATREPVEPQDAVESSAGDPCAARRMHDVRMLQEAGLQARVRRSFESGDGGALSIVQQFATPAGATAAQKAFVAGLDRDWPGCDEGVTTTAFDTTTLDHPPGATLAHTVQTGRDVPGEAWNVFFTDGRFLYTVGAIGTGVTRDAVVAAAGRAYDKRAG
ncbi:MAG TPA: hypothetical protein PKD59_02555 [Miltoncostaeaceae bacterium]|nr:hypothetical protein [Miltoncostaeaceae bacterium]